jgi:hypothetical protein
MGIIEHMTQEKIKTWVFYRDEWDEGDERYLRIEVSMLIPEPESESEPGLPGFLFVRNNRI